MRVLLIEDSPSDAALVLADLAEAAPEIEVARASSLAEAGIVARGWTPDALLLDLGLPDSLGLDTVLRAREAFPDSAVVVLTGTADEALAGQSLAGSAQDYLVKGEVGGPAVARALRYALERHRAERRHADATSRLGAIIDRAGDALYLGEFDGPFEMVNRAACQMLGYTREELLGMRRADVIAPELLEQIRHLYVGLEGEGHVVVESVHVAKSGRRIPVEAHAEAFREGDRTLLLTSVRETSARKRAQARQRLLLDVLARLTRHGDLSGATEAIVSHLRAHTELEAMAVRVHEAGALPYVAAEGFEEGHRAADWVGACPASCAGDPDGLPPCLCGQVIEAAATGPWATAYGSLRIGSASELSDAMDAVRRERPVIGTCLAEGYESVALVPLRCDGRIMGLLQACDRRPGVLTDDVMWCLEAVADAVGVAIAQQRDLDALRASEARYRDLLERMEEGVWVIDADSRTTYANPCLARMLGYTQQEMLGRHLLEFMDETMVAQAEYSIDRRRRGIAEKHDFRFRKRDGSALWTRVSTVPRFDQHDRFAGAQALVTDIGALRESERVQRRLIAGIAQSAIATAVTDATGSVLYVNDACLGLHGTRLDDVLGTSLSSLCESLLDPLSCQCALLALERGQQWRGRTRAQTPTHGERSLDVVMSPVFDLQGELIGHVAMAQDVTGVEALEERLRQSQKMEALGTLAGGVAHDFNNLLAVMRGHTELLTMDLPADDPALSRLEEITQAADRAADLVRQLLAFSRKQVLRPQSVDVNRLTGDMAKMLRRLLTEDIELRLDLAPGLSTVHADPGRLHQVLANLVVNARDAMPGGGEVRIATHPQELHQGTLVGGVELEAGSYVALTVSDTGEGMAPEVAARVFEPFFTTKGDRGTGLGLATVYGIAVQSRGAIEVARSTPAGTVMRMLLPVCPADGESAAATGAAGVATAPSGGGEMILIVEDDPGVGVLAGAILERAGYRTVVADRGAAAMEAVAAHGAEISLILSDVVLPDMRGPEVLDRVAGLAPHARGLLMSGYVDDTLQASRALDGSWELLMKPFTAEQLLRAVRTALAG